jgi:son of sevenless-like protein
MTLESILGRKDVTEKLISSGKGFAEAVKFYLPKLLLAPIFHCANYFKYLEVSSLIATH